MDQQDGSVRLVEASSKEEYETSASALVDKGYRPSSDLRTEPYTRRYRGGDNCWYREDRVRYIREFTRLEKLEQAQR